MKLNKILSSALVFVMLFTTLVMAIPTTAFAGEKDYEVSVDTETTLTNEEIKAIVSAYTAYDYDTAEEMLNAELALGYLDSVKGAAYSLYINRYTGFIYYVNNVTGQILTSNPIDPGYRAKVDYTVMSQIELTYMSLSDTAKSYTYNNINWIMNDSFLSLSEIDNGISVKYTLGEHFAEGADRFSVPASIMASSFESQIALPLFEKLSEALAANCPSITVNVDDYRYNPNEGQDKGVINPNQVTKAMRNLSNQLQAAIGSTSDPRYVAVSDIVTAINNVFSNYTVQDPIRSPNRAEQIMEQIPGTKSGEAAYQLINSELSTLRLCHRVIEKYIPGYKAAQATADEDAAGYKIAGLTIPTFTLTINYTLDSAGDLIVDLPAESISYNEDVYTVSSIVPLKYFGCGDMNNAGYIFYPDGAGTIVEFSDFYTPDENKGQNIINNRIYLTGSIYGQDYCYSSVTGAHREQITMPVYGAVNDVESNKAVKDVTGDEMTTNGYFAIIEQGSSLSKLGIESGGATHKYANAFVAFTPYPSDRYDLSASLSVSNLGFYYMVAESRYTGNFVTRFNMLTDTDVANSKNLSHYYAADYVGMAECYRDYLKASGALTALEDAGDNLPLYIEALGSIQVVEKILSFPVTVSVPLTTFDDVQRMYSELSDVNKTLDAKIAECDSIIAATPKDDVKTIEQYETKKAAYVELKTRVQNITNINFKLTGFANGGMYATYPAKLEWEDSVGGHNGFVSLINNAAEATKKDGYTFGVYPDFDFSYISRTSLFDNVGGIANNVSKMVDNRYASKQAYNSISQVYETLYALVVSPDAMNRLYNKFENDYSGYNWKQLSVSTLGSDLNSNFDKENPINREQSLGLVSNLLDKMASKNGYTLMTDVGNAYAIQYADHVIGASTDSSHFRYSSYAVPFFGLVYHGYVSYSGSPLNYSGSPDYDMLRAIENGASLYYVLCAQNTNHLKEDQNLSKYYGVDYENWYDKIIEQYAYLNNAIGTLQNYEIVDHRIILSERIIDAKETLSNNNNIVAEFVDAADASFAKVIAEKLDEMLADNANINKGLKVTVDLDGILAMALDVLELTEEEAASTEVEAKLAALVEKYTTRYSGANYAAPVTLAITADDVVYETKYNYVTDSVATDSDYDYTDFTCDNGNVVMVVYRDAATGDQVVFILNYNVFSVDIRIDNTIDPTLADGESKVITLGACKYAKVGKEGVIYVGE